MKIGQQRSIEVVGVENNKNFSIEATGKAFKILSSGLYSRKIEAIVRELSCNAYDAHIAAKTTDQAVDVKIPSSLSPIFSIRDYGTGLSKSDILNLYSTYFYSNKNMSNDFIGAMGLGSKSPFSYVDSFSVISYYNKKKYSFICYIDEDDKPNITLVNEMDTIEKNGLQIEIPVEENDIYEFSTVCKKIHMVMDCKFKYIDSSLEFINFKDMDYLYKSDYFTKYESNNSWSSGLYAYMGGVLYPIDTNSLDNKMSTDYNLIKRTSMYLDSSDTGITIFYFDIGELDVAASREELQYNKQTLNTLEKRMNDIKKQVEIDYINLKSKIKDIKSFLKIVYYLENGNYRFWHRQTNLFTINDEIIIEPCLSRLYDYRNDSELVFKIENEKINNLIKDNYNEPYDEYFLSAQRFNKYNTITCTYFKELINTFLVSCVGSDKTSYRHADLKLSSKGYNFISIFNSAFANCFIAFRRRSPKDIRLIKGYLQHNQCFSESVPFCRVMYWNDRDVAEYILGTKDFNSYLEVDKIPKEYIKELKSPSNRPKEQFMFYFPLNESLLIEGIDKVSFCMQSLKGFYNKKHKWFTTEVNERNVELPGVYFETYSNKPIIKGRMVDNAEFIFYLFMALKNQGHKRIYFYPSSRKPSAKPMLKNKIHIDDIIENVANEYIDGELNGVYKGVNEFYINYMFRRKFKKLHNRYAIFGYGYNKIEECNNIFQEIQKLLKENDDKKYTKYDILEFIHYLNVYLNIEIPVFSKMKKKVIKNVYKALENDYNKINNKLIILFENHIPVDIIDEIQGEIK